MKIITLILLSLFSAPVHAQTSTDDYCKYVEQTASADGTRLKSPSLAAGVTQPNTGTAPQTFGGLTGSLSDLHRGKLVVDGGRANCQLYKSTSDAQQAISHAADYLEQQALKHRIELDTQALVQLADLINNSNKLVEAQSATKLSTYTLQSAKSRIIQDRAASERSLTTHFLPDLPDAPLSALVDRNQEDEINNQKALNRITNDQNWGVRWEVGYHKTIKGTVGVLTNAGAYAGFTATYNLGSVRSGHKIAESTKSFSEWRHNEYDGVYQGAEQLRQQVVEALKVEKDKIEQLKTQESMLNENLELIKDVSTSAAITFGNQLSADRLLLAVDMRDAEFRLSQLQEYLAYNFESGQKGPAVVSITFDDGYESAYQNALPILEKAHIKGTWYIITKTVDHKSYITTAQLKDLANRGQEIGSHTQTHPHLATLTLAQQKKEISGSVEDLRSLGINPTSFAYPYGQYNDDSFTALKDAGLKNARTTSETMSGRDPYRLQGLSLTSKTTFDEIEHAIKQAQAQGTWVILTFHRVDDSSDGEINVSSKLLQRIVDYITENHIQVKTVGE
jgi:peptidoglycan/xylan/chitin deacetylase (PgdA/CDA1 family)